VQKLYQRMDEEEEEELQKAQQVFDEALNRIATIEDHYRQSRHCLEQALKEAEQKRSQCRAEEVEWGTQSRVHLEWMLEHEPSYKDYVVRRYKL
jgi:hypothetical protein